MFRVVRTLTMTLGTAAIALSTDTSTILARQKNPVQQYHCKCGCQYRDEANKWHWGNDATFISSNCYLGAGLHWDCKTSDGQTHKGNLVGCEFGKPVSGARAGGETPPKKSY
jgi:hypothetical protein